MSQVGGMVNLSAPAILSRCAPDTWFCWPSASSIVHDTDLHSIPTEPPRMLRAPGIVELQRRLWTDPLRGAFVIQSGAWAAAGAALS